MKKNSWLKQIAPVAALLSLGLSATGARAEGDVVFACFGGAVQQNYQRLILPAFEQKYNVKVRYIPGVSTHFISQMQAQRAKPEFDVACMDDGPQSVARELGLLRPIKADAVPNYADTIPSARGTEDSGVGYGLLAMGITYVPDALKKAGIAPPKSWNDLVDPRFKGLIGMSSIGATPGLFTLAMLSLTNGGTIENAEPGFAKMKELAKNVMAFGAGGDMSKQLQQGEAAVSVWTNGETARFVKRTGFQLEFVYPQEGAPIVMPMLSLVKDSPNQRNAELLINYLISEEVQAILVRESRVGPVNSKVKLTPELADGIVYGDAITSKLLKLDWTALNKQRPAWTERWNREIER